MAVDFATVPDSTIECVFAKRPDFAQWAASNGWDVSTVARRREFLVWWWPARGDSWEYTTPGELLAAIGCLPAEPGGPGVENSLITWAKQNPVAAGAIGLAAYLFLFGKRRGGLL